ncbi:MAG: hypothetical protein FJ311_04805 [Rhodospirillales bacterium]|nr:hypothetical protein [Rhodospirillales bacterium]
MTLQTDLQAAVAKTTAAADKLHQVVHGDATSTVETESGPVKTVAKTVADNEAAIAASRAELDQKVADAAGSAIAAAGSAIAASASAGEAAIHAAKIPDPAPADSLKSIRVNPAGTAYELAPGGGDVVGPAGVADGALARFDGVTGKLLKAGGPAQTSEIADGAVTAAKLADGAVTAEKIAPGAVDLATRVAKAGDAMTGDLSLPNLIASGTVRSGATGDDARATGFKIADGTDIGELNRSNQYYDDRVNNCAGYLPNGNCLGDPRWTPPNGDWWTWGLGFSPGNPSGYDFAGGQQVAYQPVSVGFVHGSYALAADEIGGAEYRRNYNNCNCGGFNCYSNCNCNCNCACDCNCACCDG